MALLNLAKQLLLWDKENTYSSLLVSFLLPQSFLKWNDFPILQKKVRTAACLIPGHFLSLKGGVAIGRGLNQRSWLDHFLGVTVCDSYRTDLEALRGWDCLTFFMSQMSAVNGTLW